VVESWAMSVYLMYLLDPGARDLQYELTQQRNGKLDKIQPISSIEVIEVFALRIQGYV
jgi:hypothetical protein